MGKDLIFAPQLLLYGHRFQTKTAIQRPRSLRLEAAYTRPTEGYKCPSKRRQPKFDFVSTYNETVFLKIEITQEPGYRERSG